MNKTRLLGVAILCLFLAAGCGGEKPESSRQSFDLENLAAQNGDVAVLNRGKGFRGRVLKIHPVEDNQRVFLWDVGGAVDWGRARYLVCEIWHGNTFGGVVDVEFYGEGFQAVDDPAAARPRPRMTSKTGILPGLKTKIVFPLEYLDGQNIFMRRFPRQLKATILGSRLEPGEITRVALRFGPFQEAHFRPEFEIAAVYLTETEPEPFEKARSPVVDEFGQWTARDWQGKIRSKAELKDLNESLRALAAKARFPEDWSRFGGWTKLDFGGTGFFRTHHDGKRWWLVDPDGCAFISNGVDCIGTNASGVVGNQEDLFAWLPDGSDPLFAPAVGGRRGLAQVDFYRANLIRSFGTGWREAWAGITAGLMKDLQFNTVGNWSDVGFAREAKLPYVLPLNGFPSTKVMLFRDFPDVFSTEFDDASVRFAAQLEPFKDDPYLIGYFLRNEPTWAFGSHNLAFEMFATAQASSTKDEFAVWIRKRYGDDLERFNRTWEIDLADFGDLPERTFKEIPSPAAENDFLDFTGVLVERYVGRPCDEVAKIDPNHLNLGMRYAWISSDLLYKAGARFDVFSINGYGNPGPPDTAEISRRSGKPVMIGEFHFGATDRGLPATGIQAALNQTERGKAYRYYVEQGFSRPELVGIHYFQWIDQPVMGRFDGENYNIGIVDICNRPYREFMEAARLTNGRVYGVAAGETAPFDQIILNLPPIHY